MKNEKLRVKSNIELAPGVFRMVLERPVCGKPAMVAGEPMIGSKLDEGEEIKPGQFLELKIDELFLRRPISICDVDGNFITIVYKAVGRGTEKMSLLNEGTILDALLPLGNGYDLDKAGESPLLVGGGVGAPPLYYLAKKLIERGIKKPTVILGFNTASEVFLADDFAALGCEVTVTTVDGTYGLKGYPTEANTGTVSLSHFSPGEHSYFYCCGPMPLLKAVYRKAEEIGLDGEFSLEERMGCGFGACMGCSIEVIGSPCFKRVCKDGPVFRKEELPW